MELIYNPTNKKDFESFQVVRKQQPYFGGDWHYHEEYEILFTIKGDGVRIVGDSMDYFSDPELILIGKNTPHVFRNECKTTNETVDCIVIKFGDFFDGYSLFNLPEMRSIKNLLNKAQRGILFSTQTVNKVKSKLIKLQKLKGVNRILALIEILNLLSNEEDLTFLASENFVLNDESRKEERIKNIINYISENYTKDISLEDLAKVSYMTTNSFCRYFKNKTGKTAFQFIREYRISKACQMLINNNDSISEICYDIGFNSFSTFNRIFKNLKNVSASEYRSKYTKSLAV